MHEILSTGFPSIKERQESQRAILFAKAWQNPRHGLHTLARQFTRAAEPPDQNRRSLRHTRHEVAPRSHLKRKSWIELAALACRRTCDSLPLSNQPPWQLASEEEGWHQPAVIVKFNRECREWPQGAAEAACQEMFQELGQEGILIIATDGSFTPGSMRAGWGFAAFLDGKLIAERCGATTLYTSSTRMELEAVKQALGWLAQESPDVRVVVFATDSMAILQKIKNGWLPDGWREVEPYLNDKSPTFTYFDIYIAITSKPVCNKIRNKL